MKLLFRLLTEESVFLFPHKYSGMFAASNQSHFGDDAQLTVSRLAPWQMYCTDREVCRIDWCYRCSQLFSYSYFTKIYSVLYQSSPQLARETAHSFSFFLFQDTFFCLLPLPFKKPPNRQHIPTCGRTIFALTQPRRWSHGWKSWQTLHLCRQSLSKGLCQCCHFVRGKKNYSVSRFEWRKNKICC